MRRRFTSESCPHWDDGKHSPMRMYFRRWWGRRVVGFICISCTDQEDVFVYLNDDAPKAY